MVTPSFCVFSSCLCFTVHSWEKKLEKPPRYWEQTNRTVHDLAQGEGRPLSERHLLWPCWWDVSTELHQRTRRVVSFLLSALGWWQRKSCCADNCAILGIIIHHSILFCKTGLFWREYSAKFWNQIAFSSLKCSFVAISNCRSNRKQANTVIFGPWSQVITGKQITAAISSLLWILLSQISFSPQISYNVVLQV